MLSRASDVGRSPLEFNKREIFSIDSSPEFLGRGLCGVSKIIGYERGEKKTKKTHWASLFVAHGLLRPCQIRQYPTKSWRQVC